MRLHAAHILLAVAPAIYATNHPRENSQSSPQTGYHSIVGRSQLITDSSGGPGNSSSLDATPSNPSLGSTSNLYSSSSPSNISLGSTPNLYSSSSPSNLSLGSTPDVYSSSSPSNTSGTTTPSLKKTSKVTAAVSKSWEQMLEHALNATLATLPGLEGVADEIQKLVSAQMNSLENQTAIPDLQNAGDSINKTSGVSIGGSASANVTQNVSGEGEMQGRYANGTRCEGLFVAMRTLEESVSKDATEKTTKLVEKIKGCISYSMLSVIKIVATPEVTKCKVAPAQTVFSSRIESNMTLIAEMIAELKQNNDGDSSLTVNNTLSANTSSTVQANLTKTTRKPCRSSRHLQGGKSGLLGTSARNGNSLLNASAGEAQYISPLNSTGEAQYISPSNSTGEAQYFQNPGSLPSNSSTGEAQYIQGTGSSPPSTSTGQAQYIQGSDGPLPVLQKRDANTMTSVGPALYRSGPTGSGPSNTSSVGTALYRGASTGSDPSSTTSVGPALYRSAPTGSDPSNISSVGPALYRSGPAGNGHSSANATLSGGYNSAFNVSSWSDDDDENCDPTLPPLDEEEPPKKDSTHHKKKKQAIKEVEKCYNATIPAVTGVINSNPKEGISGIHLGKSSQSKIKVNVASYVTINSPTIYNFITQVNGGSGARTDDDDITPPKNTPYPGAPTSPGGGGASYPGGSSGGSNYPGGGSGSGGDYPGGGSSYPGGSSGGGGGGGTYPDGGSGNGGNYPGGGSSYPGGSSGGSSYPDGGSGGNTSDNGASYPGGGSCGGSMAGNEGGYPSSSGNMTDTGSGYPSSGGSSPCSGPSSPSGSPSGYPSGGPSGGLGQF
ncbi:uncharacterized protein MELLADRAFT_63842 [Melampsora larici-populina 98AG31]|uniref:Secreted protein n=1 Tax=Melampsora larici-populina (strain 98AG31 / pathotype 3-4-7) TaxID=747676 RepID=F4RPC2_MELLP|nr:uncharacterized protein MELLADRAFT_63842 [Melampsora larici-populina 98AG31]EGG05790.1 hypothetical protein MELLADRAFT_63842 [Melampsora larici-populina 98AG31]